MPGQPTVPGDGQSAMTGVAGCDDGEGCGDQGWRPMRPAGDEKAFRVPGSSHLHGHSDKAAKRHPKQFIISHSFVRVPRGHAGRPACARQRPGPRPGSPRPVETGRQNK